jgi:outer membrane protein OmpA-like peptidoglycan-associated protein
MAPGAGSCAESYFKKESIMRNFTKLISIGLLSVAGVAASSLAQAQDVTLRLETGVAAPLAQPQTDHFGAGIAGAAKINVGLTPYLDVVPGISALALSGKGTADVGTAWGFGGGLRLKRPHNNDGDGVDAVSPWVDNDLQYVRTGGLDRVGLSLAVGAAWPTSDDRNLWVGPYVRYQNVFQGERIGFDNRDAKVLSVGLSLEIDPAAKKAAPATVKTVTHCPDRDRDGTPDAADRCPDVPGPASNNGCPLPPAPVAQERMVIAKHVVQFTWDSSLLSSKARADLDVAVKQIASSKDNIVVSGHASSDGQVEHNNKLALRRAKAVLEYLVSKGVARERVSVVGFGSGKPVVSNNTQVGREINRRAEFVVSFIVVKEGK